ncbi:MAG: VOC family protein [Saprospiraceae bacterium]
MPKNLDLHFFKVQHIGIPVKDMEISVDFYSSLGFKNVMQSPFEILEGKGVCTMMQKGEIVMELYQLPESLRHEILNRRDGHIDHVAFDIDDIEGAFKKLKQEGFNVLQEAPVFLPFWDKGVRFFHIMGPDNERLEFNQIL